MILVIKSIAFHVSELRMKCALYIQAQTFSGDKSSGLVKLAKLTQVI